MYYNQTYQIIDKNDKTTLSKLKKYFILYDIYTNNIIIVKNDENTLIQFYTESINNIHDTIKNIKFDKMEGKFVEELNNIMEKEFELLFADCSNIKLTWDKCPCCFDETKTKTPCNHPMCIECWGKLELKQEDDDDYYIQICPICKNDMPHQNR